MLTKRTHCLLLAGLSILCFQTQAATFALKNFHVVPDPSPTQNLLTGNGVLSTAPGGYDVVQTPVTSSGSRILVQPTATTSGVRERSMSTSVTTTHYVVDGATQNYDVTVKAPAVNSAVQKVRVSGIIESDFAQTLTFHMSARGAYETFTDDDGDLRSPDAPAFKYRFQNDYSDGFRHGVNQKTTYSDQVANQKNGYTAVTDDQIPLVFDTHMLMYFSAQFTTSGHQSIDEFLVSVTGALSGGTAGMPKTNTNTMTFNESIPATVPEPETYALLLAGLGVTAWVGRRNKGRTV